MTARSKEIRVGIIRCDTHGYWYANIFEKPNPEMMRKNHRGCHYYFYKYDDPSKQRLRPVPGMRITKVFHIPHPVSDSFYPGEADYARGLSECFDNRPIICDSYEEVSDDVDLVFIANCDLEGDDHLKLATPGLKKGVPTFIDKPFAGDLKMARQIMRLAHKHNTPLMSASLLRFCPHLELFHKRFADIAPVGIVYMACGVGGRMGYVHSVSRMQCIMGGEGCEWVETQVGGASPIRWHYPGPAGGTDILTGGGSVIPKRLHPPPRVPAYYHHCTMGSVSAYGARGAIHARRVDDYIYPEAGVKIVRMAKKMALTRKNPIPHSSIMELMEMMEAGVRAVKAGKRIYLEDVRAS